MQVKLQNLPPLQTVEETDFECKRCGKCCRGRFCEIILSPVDVLIISQYLGMSREEFIQKKTMKHVPIPKNGELIELTLKTYGKKQECCFYNPRTGCEIHEVSPVQCYSFPFIIYDGKKGLFVQQPLPDYCGKHGEKVKISEWLNRTSNRYESEMEMRHMWEENFNKLNLLCKGLSTAKKEEIFETLYLKLESPTVSDLWKCFRECDMIIG